LATFYLYDGKREYYTWWARGLAGDGLTNQQAAACFFLQHEQLLTHRLMRVGERINYFYTNTWLLSRMSRPRSPAVTSIVTNSFLYYGVTNPLQLGPVQPRPAQSGSAGDGSADEPQTEWSESIAVIPTNQVNTPARPDPNVTNQFVYNGRGELGGKERWSRAGSGKFALRCDGRPVLEEVV